MRINVSKFKNWKLQGPDGCVGSVQDVLVDDDRWLVRYLVVAVGSGLMKQKVLVAPEFIIETNNRQQQFSTYLRKDVITNCPRLEWVQPISRQYREALADYFGTLTYRIGSAIFSPQRLMELTADQATTFVDESKPTSLRSLKEILHYKVVDSNGQSAGLTEISVNTKTWSAERATTNLSFGRQDYEKSIPMNRIKEVDWNTRVLRLDGRTQLKPNLEPRFENSWAMSLSESAVF